MPRPCKCRTVGMRPSAMYFKPIGVPLCTLEEVALPVDGLEALRLADLEGLSATEAARRMGVSRHTFGRILGKARRATAQALVQGLALRVESRQYVEHADMLHQPEPNEEDNE